MSVRILASALNYAWQGIPVFPCDPRSKKPYCASGFYAASTDAICIKAWWGYLDDAMIGMPCGAPSGLWVLDVDVDPSKGIDGASSLRELIRTRGVPWMATRMSATPRGGVQYFFRSHDEVDIRNSASKIAKGLDTRGDGGYVVLPPSVRADGTPYRWLNALPPVDAPAWLIDAALSSARHTPEHTTSGGPSAGCNGMSGAATSPRSRAWAMAALRIACERIAAAGAGTRNAILNAEAFDLFRIVAGGNLEEAQVRACLLQAATDSGLVADDGTPSVLATIKSAADGAERASPRFYSGR